MSNTAENAIGSSAEARPLERRRNTRYAFIADVEVLEPKSGMALKGRSADLSRGGCYLDTINPFPPDTLVKLRLTKWDQSFEAQAKVVYSTVGMGMGLMFMAVDREQRWTVEEWINELSRQQRSEVDLTASGVRP
jgi:c-di-GMP-binding flagellar brake protein YcgR